MLLLLGLFPSSQSLLDMDKSVLLLIVLRARYGAAPQIPYCLAECSTCVQQYIRCAWRTETQQTNLPFDNSHSCTNTAVVSLKTEVPKLTFSLSLSQENFSGVRRKLLSNFSSKRSISWVGSGNFSPQPQDLNTWNSEPRQNENKIKPLKKTKRRVYKKIFPRNHRIEPMKIIIKNKKNPTILLIVTVLSEGK